MRTLFCIIAVGLTIACRAGDSHVTISMIDRGRPAAFDSCGVRGRVRYLRIRDSLAAVVSEARPGQVCVFDAVHGRPLKSPSFTTEPLIHGIGFIGNRLWISDALTRRVMYFSISTGDFVNAVDIPTLEPMLLPVVVDVSDSGEMMVLHLPTEAASDSVFVLITKLNRRTEYEIIDSLLELAPSIRIQASVGPGVLKLGHPWFRADLLSEPSANGLVLVRQLSAEGSDVTVETLGYSSRWRGGHVGAFAPRTLSPATTTKWVNSSLADSLVNLVGGREHVMETVIRTVKPPIPLPPFARVIALTRHRLFLQQNWPDGDRWELRSGTMRLLGTVTVGAKSMLYVGSGESVWGIEYSSPGKEHVLEWLVQ